MQVGFQIERDFQSLVYIYDTIHKLSLKTSKNFPLSYEDFEYRYTGFDGVICVAKERRNILAFSIVSFVRSKTSNSSNLAFLEYIFVHPKFRSYGVGKNLFIFTYSTIRNFQYRTLFWYCNPSDYEANRFYDSLPVARPTNNPNKLSLRMKTPPTPKYSMEIVLEPVKAT